MLLKAVRMLHGCTLLLHPVFLQNDSNLCIEASKPTFLVDLSSFH